MRSCSVLATIRHGGRLGSTLGLSLGLCLAAQLLAGTSQAAPASESEALALVRERKLATSPAWRRLLRYQPRTEGRWRSQIDGEESFLARGGEDDPEAELEATVRGFFAAPVRGREDLHASCRFPARRRWLDAQLGPSRVHPVVCPALERFVAELDAASVTFVYASSFVENPASGFGHTFLRVGKRRDATATSEPSEAADRRDHGIDYTATTDTDNPLLYAFKGVAGLFPGLFRFRTYDVMLREYGAYEGRDLWEYELALTPSEVELLVLHLWELDHARLDYFYATENCSYQLLAALDAAAPRLDLVQGLKGAVFPLDTAQAVHAWPGLVRSVVYRPSVRSQLRASLAQLGDPEQALVDALAQDPEVRLPADLAPSVAARVLEAARLVVELHHAKSMGDGQAPAAQGRRDRLLQRRAAWPVAEAAGPPRDAETGPTNKPPHESHGSMRLLLGTGMTSQHGTGFATLGYRFALHDLADPPDGQPELLQLQFLDLRLRYDHGRRKVTLDALTFAELLALNPLRRFEQKLSWRVRAFGTRLHDRAAPDAFAHGAEVAVGATLGTESDQLVAFVMADAYVAFAEGVDGLGGSPVRPGVGPWGGLRVRLPARSVGLVTAGVSYLPAQRLDATFDVRASWRMGLSKDVAMGLEGSAQPRALELQLGSYLYF